MSTKNSKPYASIPITAEVTDGFRDISFSDIANGVNNFAFQLEKLYGRSEEFATITYVGINDLRYVMVFLGAIKCGYKTLLISPRNPPATNLSLMATTKSTKLLYTAELAPLFKGMCAANSEIVGTQLSSFDEMIISSPPFLYSEVWSKAINKPVLGLHSSGSTGTPKPVVMTHGTFAVLGNEASLPMVPGRVKQDLAIWNGKDSDSSRFYHIFPTFHLAGFVTTVVIPILGNGIPVLGPPTRPPNGHLIIQVMKQHTLRALFVPPSLAEAVCQEPGGLELISRLEFVCYAGGPLSDAIGDRLSQVTKLCQIYGSTELLSMQQLFPKKETWAYLEWNPHGSFRMRPAEDDMHELIVLTDQRGQITIDFTSLGVKEYETRDLFKQHPTEPGLWKFCGRRDDIVVLSNGQKFNPIPIESTLQGHVAGALVVGQGRFQAGLIVEPKPDTDTSTILDNIWPIVQEANKLVPGYGRITRNMIRLSDPARPFVRAAKGTVIWKMTEKLYEQDIHGLYENYSVQEQSSVLGPRLRASFKLEDVTSFVREVITSSFPDTELRDDDDLYVAGLDSVHGLVPRVSSTLNEGAVHNSTGLVVALIGTSGYLGSALLDRLNLDERITKIYSLTRAPANQSNSHPKVKHLKVQYSQPQFGLKDPDFQELSSQCHVLILNAWKVNFNHSLKSFEDNIKSLRTSLDLVAKSPHNARLTFVSSISAVENYLPDAEIPEALLGPEFGDIALPMGYAQSKLVAERILLEAGTKYNFPITVLRVGQIAGSTDPNSKSMWPVTDAIPLIIATSKIIGYLPELRNVD
ncbi:Acetyl-CoA synthetase-like protein [Glarea lozoyensis ATCC 20868]|uniref:Acetyl-CoA synthetase-like protein n=1 Tax=Glarea lozoyensis (strain ATCC 20868 / MF5171) TaxID=1116229 RepID=S3E4L9_GLAL2|nr:Acetyl-CoA synthetase-like protein [Glarea lozoyensis ATCC 20868]EPE33348.1 Acetyl-CoA synthetase-like protein [Glarea lozoyensis ATCC 20868]